MAYKAKKAVNCKSTAWVKLKTRGDNANNSPSTARHHASAVIHRVPKLAAPQR